MHSEFNISNFDIIEQACNFNNYDYLIEHTLPQTLAFIDEHLEVLVYLICSFLVLNIVAVYSPISGLLESNKMPRTTDDKIRDYVLKKQQQREKAKELRSKRQNEGPNC